MTSATLGATWVHLLNDDNEVPNEMLHELTYTTLQLIPWTTTPFRTPPFSPTTQSTPHLDFLLMLNDPTQLLYPIYQEPDILFCAVADERTLVSAHLFISISTLEIGVFLFLLHIRMKWWASRGLGDI